MWDIYMSKTSELEPADVAVKKSINILSGLLDDEFIKKLNPRRFIYYKKFINSLNDEEGLRRFMYTLQKIKENKHSTDKIYKKIVKLTDQLASLNTDTPNYNTVKRDKLKTISDRVLKILQDKTNNYDSPDKENLLEDITSSFISSNKEKIGGADITVDDSNDYLDKYSRKIENIIDNKTEKDDTKISKYKDILNEIDNVINPTHTLSVTKEDKILFIIISFIIRLITINIVNSLF